MKKLIITAAVNGGITSRQKHPGVPFTPEEIAESVYQCWSAGAAVAHIHARDEHGNASYQFEKYHEIAERIRDKCDILINFSTSGLNLPPHLDEKEAWNHLCLRPEIASFNCGSVNHGNKPFINSPALAKRLATDIAEYKVKAEIEVYHQGIIGEALALREQGFLQGVLCFSFALGIPGGAAATCKNLLHFVESIPQDSVWSALGIGKSQLSINLHTMLLGGHVRTGLEDNVYYQYGELARDNAQLVERLVTLSREVGRDVASPDEARAILGIAARH
ncbi:MULTISPECIES: 3-keto-5-aminohexanoate cleavage protein [unclassified Janthinobacterium]|uniref:3-keto-5-aminohexanoate cleavage protein n=1 Tax=unclassified Janthinobacterium TaxID=2610881 RepID=UPI0003480900|nr:MULTISPECIES: 3-keto-5-aminohexanoate cleavage protein [unclassified Janthinobacterium]MEC5161733.1 3-keto-5-aminohexanoate cleavage enzyme [Janthinobacterium sp. CG_S6]